MRFTRTLLSAIFLLIIVGGVAAVSVGYALVKREQAALPPTEALRDYHPATGSRFLAADGSVMGQFAEQNRTIVPLDQIPAVVVQAFVSAEDRSFWTHRGVDPAAMARAAVTNLRLRGQRKHMIGASTITQQVVKNVLMGDEASFRRKFREALMAMRVERELGKRKVMEIYLNEIYLGQGAYGVAAAAQAYFGKPLAELGVTEASFLAGLPKGPSNYDPVRRPDAALARRGYVVQRMQDDGAITAEQADAARAAPLPKPAPRNLGAIAEGYFSEEVRRASLAKYGADALYRGGMTVHTSMDPALQALAERSLREGLEGYDRHQGWRGPLARLPEGTRLSVPQSWRSALVAVEAPSGLGDWRMAAVLASSSRDATLGFVDGTTSTIGLDGVRWAKRADGRGGAPRSVDQALRPGDVILVGAPIGGGAGLELHQMPEIEGAMVAVEARTGRVLAMAGGFSFERSSFNRVTQSRRQPGSSFKPFVYLTALEHGYDPTSPILDSPIAIDLGPAQERWRPESHGGGMGLVTLRQGLERSLNMASVRLLYDIGLEEVGETSRRFGLYDHIPNYAAALGAMELTPLQLTTAYAMLANGGYRVTPSLVDDVVASNGTVMEKRILPSQDEASRIAPATAVAQITSMLKGVVRHGTAASALGRIDLPLAGKTGTTNESNDVWFVGFSPDIAVGVHIGFDQPTALGGGEETGGHLAAPVFGAFMKGALALHPPSSKDFTLPPGMHLVRLDPETGDVSKAGVEEVVVEPTPADKAPTSSDRAPH